MDRRSCGIIAAVVGLLLIIGVICVCLIGVAGIAIFRADSSVNLGDFGMEIPGSTTSTPVVVRPGTEATVEIPQGEPQQDTLEPADRTPAPLPGSDGISGSSVSTDTLKTLDEALVPPNDPQDLALRLGGQEGIPQTLEAPAASRRAGETDQFWVTNTDTNESYQVDATLRYVTDHLYFWVEDGVSFDQDNLEQLSDTFENEIYPTNREFFGSEWSPGVDGDVHLYILYARELGGNVAGYFSSADELHPLAHEYSNAHEMFMLSAQYVALDEEFAYSVLAHEFQHMIHWYRDRNEESWMNEGFSELAAFLNGYDVGGADWLYVQDPDIQLNTWPNDPNATTPHYGNSFLFLAYFLDRFGEDATKALVADPENGMKSIDNVLAQIGATDPKTGEPLTSDDVFADWAVTSYLQDSSVDDGRYDYHSYSNAPRPAETENISSCPTGIETREVHQYGVDYIRIDCEGEATLRFEGSVQVEVVPENPHSGDYAFWSNRGDESDMTLTQTFDFSDVSGPLTLSYWTWYDIEEDYDYLYLTASTDGGETWQILETPSGTDEDPSGNGYGWGYNGVSRRWIEESVDISQFAGEAQVSLRFEYVTDAAVNGEGFLLDDISIPEIDYNSDFEDGDGGWEAEGWVRIENILPQTFRLTLISYGDETTVEQIEISADNSAEIPIQIGRDVEEVVLVVSGTTPFTRQQAAYRFEIQ